MTAATGTWRQAVQEHGVTEAIPFTQQERRFLLSRAQATTFLAAIAPHVVPEIYDRSRPIAYARTTYFDTDDLDYFRSCAGPVARRLRVREYALAPTPSDTPTLGPVAYLELKQSAGSARAKARIAAPPELILAVIDGEHAQRTQDGRGQRAQIDRLAGDGADDSAALIADELRRHRVHPRVGTWYRRVSLVSDDGAVRITLDDGLTFFKPQPLGRPGEPAGPGPDIIASGPAYVLETKHGTAPPSWLEMATQGLLRAPGFSKFQTGMLALAPRPAWMVATEGAVGAALMGGMRFTASRTAGGGTR